MRRALRLSVLYCIVLSVPLGAAVVPFASLSTCEWAVLGWPQTSCFLPAVILPLVERFGATHKVTMVLAQAEGSQVVGTLSLYHPLGCHPYSWQPSIAGESHFVSMSYLQHHLSLLLRYLYLRPASRTECGWLADCCIVLSPTGKREHGFDPYLVRTPFSRIMFPLFTSTPHHDVAIRDSLRRMKGVEGSAVRGD